MDRSAARHAYEQQKSGSKARGIDWEFNFQSWLDWWGNDIDRRGCGPNDLQMQRFADSGPYAAWNVRKGVPRDNAKTRGLVQRTRASGEAKNALEAARYASIGLEPSRDELSEDEAFLRSEVGLKSSYQMTGFFAADK